MDSNIKLYSFGRAAEKCGDCFPNCRHPASHVPPGSRLECVRTCEITPNVLRKFKVRLADLVPGSAPIGLTTLNNHSRLNSISVTIDCDNGGTYSLITRSGAALPAQVIAKTTDYPAANGCSGSECPDPPVVTDGGTLAGFGAIPAGFCKRVIELWYGPDALNTLLDELQLQIDSVPNGGLKEVPCLTVCVNYETAARC